MNTMSIEPDSIERTDGSTSSVSSRSHRVWQRAADIALLLVSISIIGYAGSLVVGPRRSTFEAATTHLSANDWERIARGGTRFGPAGKRVEVVVFSDFQCPYCEAFSRAVKQLDPALRADATFEFRHFPLTSLHPHAFEAAIAAECGGRQGKFGELHDDLFKYQDSIGIKPWDWYARNAAVSDLAEFNRCVDLAAPRARIDSDLAESRLLHLRGTPTVIVDGAILPGTPNVAELSSALRAAEHAHR